MFHNFFSIDATHTTQIGKYVNDSPFPNAQDSAIYLNGRSHLRMFASKDIPQKTEIRYTYDDIEENMWWWKNVCFKFFL